MGHTTSFEKQKESNIRGEKKRAPYSNSIFFLHHNILILLLKTKVFVILRFYNNENNTHSKDILNRKKTRVHLIGY